MLIDTNTLSEMFKPEPSPAVVDWFASQHRGELFVTTITVAEFYYGVELMPIGKGRTRVLALVEQTLAEDFRGRILVFEESAARFYAGITAARRFTGRPIAHFDAMIAAAIARSHEAKVATRHTKHFADCGVGLIDPWQFGPQSG